MLVLPYLEVKGARDVTATAHERIKFEAAVFGEPAPSVAWTKGEDPVEGVHIVNTESRYRGLYTITFVCFMKPSTILSDNLWVFMK